MAQIYTAMSLVSTLTSRIARNGGMRSSIPLVALLAGAVPNTAPAGTRWARGEDESAVCERRTHLHDAESNRSLSPMAKRVGGEPGGTCYRDLLLATTPPAPPAIGGAKNERERAKARGQARREEWRRQPKAGGDRWEARQWRKVGGGGAERDGTRRAGATGADGRAGH